MSKECGPQYWYFENFHAKICARVRVRNQDGLIPDMRAFWKITTIACAGATILGVAVAWRAYRGEIEARSIQQELVGTRARAERGDAKAEYTLGSFYYYGRSVPQNLAEALRWYRKAAEQGNRDAEYAIGYMYETGKGLQQDSAQAFSWYRTSANQGNRQAECALGTLYYDGRGVQQDDTQAALWYHRAAVNGLPRAQYDLGYLYEHGLGVPQDRVRAFKWFRKAAEQGDEHARLRLGMRLTPAVAIVLGFQVFCGALLVAGEIPLSLNMWEPNEPSRRPRDWMSLGFGLLCLFTAGISWYGYKRNLIICWIHGFTAFSLLKWALDAILIGLATYYVLKRKGTAAAERAIS